VPGHRRLSKDEALAEMPGLLADGLTGAVVYYDAQVAYVERLVVENALGAAAAGARIETHTAVEKVLLERNRVTGVEVRSTLTGERSTRHAKAIINAAGPWVDRILAAAGRPLPRFLGPTKGTHIVVRTVPGLSHTACYAEARSDGRPFFILPWNGLVLIGTTDTRCDDEPTTLRATAAEVDYLLAETRNTFPDCGLTRDDVLYTYCGVRPLPRQGLRATGAITRRHLIRHHGRSARGLTSIIGGKITTYRHLAEEVLDQVVPRLRLTARSCTTDRVPLPGGEAGRDEVLRELATFDSLPVASHAHLHAVYGSRAPLVAALARETPELGQPLGPGGPAIGAEVVFAVREEFAASLGDILLRRCMAGLGSDLGREVVPGALRVAATHLGWSEARCRAEESAYLAEIALLAPPA
jgi:glycerol-3-phosphate dehydrogenase